MGRLLAIGLLVAALGVAVIVVNGPGIDKPDVEPAASVPERDSPRTQAAAPEEDIAPTDRSRPGLSRTSTRMFSVAVTRQDVARVMPRGKTNAVIAGEA